MMIQTKKVIAMMLCLMMVIGIVSSAGAKVNEDYYEAIVAKMDNETKSATDTPSEGALWGSATDADKACVTYSYKTEGDNTYWDVTKTKLGTRNNTSVYYPNTTGNFSGNTVVFNTTGQYVIQAKIKMTAESLDSQTHGILFREKVDGAWSNYVITGVNSSSSVFSLGDETAEKIYFGTEQVGTISLEQEKWYTFTIHYDLDAENDKLTSYMEIDDEDGANLVTSSSQTATCTDSIQFYNILTELHAYANSSASIDDFTVLKQSKAPVTVNYNAEEGSVYYSGAKVVSGLETPVDYNENATFTITPASGHKIASVTAGDAGKEPQELVISGNTVTLSSVTTAKVINVTFESVDYEYKVSKYTHTGKTAGETASEGTTTGTNNGTISFTYKDDNGNIYWSADRISDETTQTSVYYPTTKNTDVTYTFTESGEYIISAKMKFGQTVSEAAHGIVFTGKNGSKTLQFVICYDKNTNTFAAGDTTGEMVGINDNGTTTQYGRIALKKDVWYTISLFYNLDYENGTGKLNMTIDDADGINQLTTTPASVSISKDAPVDFRNIRDFMQKQAGNSLGIDDFFIAKVKSTVAPALEGEPSYLYNSQDGTQTAYFTINPGSGYTFTDGIAKLCIGDSVLKLDIGEEMLSIANASGWDGRYGIRIKNSGSGTPVLVAGNSYVLAPYWVSENNSGDEATIDPVTEGRDLTGYTFVFGE